MQRRGIVIHNDRTLVKLAILVVTVTALPAWAYDTDSPYGVTAFIPSPTRWDAMRDAGIAWARCDFSWRMVEPTQKGVFNWTTTDDEVAQANARGIHIYAGLGYTPVWASAGGHSYDPPTLSQNWYDYVFACVSRYKGSVHHWELWNEPNLGQFWGGTRSQYINNILKVGSDAAHAADPDCMVLAPEISTCCSVTTWLTDVLNQAGNKIDIICHHQYDGGDVPSGRLSAIDNTHNTIVGLGYANKPIWITECGWESDTIGEQQQANYLVAMLAGMPSRPWWKKFFWYQIWEGPTGRAGILHQDETPKIAWFAQRDYALAHPAPQMVSVNLSTTDIVNGINRVVVGDGNTTQDTKASRSCRKNTNAASDYYMYFNVTDAFAFQGNRPTVAIHVDYYDLGAGTLTLEYDSTNNGAYKNGGSVALANKDTWKQITFNLTDAYFGNRQNNGADFRISAGVGMTYYLDIVQVNAPPIALPGVASNPNPADAATNVSTTATLSWTAGSTATSHDVYFGTVSPGTFQGNQAGTNFNPGPLIAGTTYFWRIDEQNAGGTTTGTIWSFTTAPPPGLASAPNPANGATSVSISAALSWTPGNGATSHDVYFGTTSPGTFQGNQAGINYNPGTLSPGTTYFWRIDEKNAAGTTTGTIWSFTTLPLPGVANNPSPANGATGVNISTNLNWTAGSNADSHDVYFGTISPGTFQGNQIGTNFNPGTLAVGTTYFSRIDEKNASGTTTGPVWTFRTASVPRADFDGDGDVDLSDFGHLQQCLSNSVPECGDADLNADAFINTTDFNVFLPCIGGANQPPGC